MKVLLGLTAAILIASAVLPLAFQAEPDLEMRPRDADKLLADYGEERLEGELKIFCTQCHGFPEPSLYPSYQWTGEIDRAYNFHEQYGDPDIVEPDSQLALAWFKKNTDMQLEIVTGEGSTVKTTFGPPTVAPNLRTRAGTSSMVIRKESGVSILTSDMLHGGIRSVESGSDGYELLFQATNPARLRPCDLSDDFDEEYLVADLGMPGVSDELKGSVVWLRKTTDADEFESITLCENIGRVSDARAADFDGDGDADVVVAEFGWNETGSVILLENDNGEFKPSTIDDRHGLVELDIADMNGDGKPDIVGVFGQELESVEVFYNTDDLTFKTEVLFAAETPSFGMSSLNLIDADADGDLDIVFTSGDMYDGFHFQDTHGLYLLTNNDGEFESRRIAEQSAILSATAGDVDGDGDIDFIGGTFIPQQSAYGRSKAYPALVLHEQTSPGVWEPRVMKCGDCCHAALELSDLDNDGDLDLVVGTLHDVSGRPEPAISVWRNELSTTGNFSLLTAGK
jgi:hypothetical protein